MTEILYEGDRRFVRRLSDKHAETYAYKDGGLYVEFSNARWCGNGVLLDTIDATSYISVDPEETPDDIIDALLECKEVDA